MKIKELYIENFGKLSKFSATFTDGLNSFVEDNGYGKTTLSVFIKAMIYGFDDTRRQSLDENDRKKYTPWQGGAFGGYLVFEARGVNYRVERTFGSKASDDTYTLYNLNTGRVSSDFSASLGEELFGIDADGFERTVFLSEKNLSGKNTNQSISAKLSNLVGTEGDIGGFDEAIKLLDERRKFYQKRGGSGEIRDVENDISELEDKIKMLCQKRDVSTSAEAEIANFNEKIAALKAKREIILEKERKERLEKEKRGYEIQYKDMLGALKTDEERESKLKEFFSAKIPSNAEVALAAESASEIKRLKRTLSDMGENIELASLKEFFSAETSAEECERMKSAAKEVAESRAVALAKSEDAPLTSPFKRMPTFSEIDRHISAASDTNSEHRSVNFALSLIGILVIIFGIFAGYSIAMPLYIFAGIGFLLTIVGILPSFLKNSSKSSAENLNSAKEFIYEIYGDDSKCESPISTLYEMKSALSEYEEKSKASLALKQEKDSFLQSVVMREREIREFLEKFPKADGLTLEEKTETIAYKRHRFDLLLEFEAEKESEKVLLKEKIKSHEERLKTFLSLFPTTSDDPISEIRRSLAEFEVIRGSLSARRSDAERFATSHGISLAPQSNANTTPAATNDFAKEISLIEEELLALERSKSRTEADYAISIREIDSIEELEEKLREKKEKISLFRDNLNVINKTKDMLAKSRDSMTSRYLDSTKRGFEKYLSLIDEATGEFTIDTSFTLMKTDLGKSRQAEAYSRGTRDMHALAMRLALVDALYGEEAPPIILDDPFIAFDDTHIENASSVLKKLARERQIFYFACSKSRRVK